MAGGPYNYSYIFKYIVIGRLLGLLLWCVLNRIVILGSSSGDMGVGKSCLLHQFTERKCEFHTVAFLHWF